MANDDHIPTTPLDRATVGAKIKDVPHRETYEKNINDVLVSSGHTEGAETASVSDKSWVLEDIERIVARDVLPNGRQRLSQFGLSLDRKNDFRLKELTRRLTSRSKRDFEQAASKGTVVQQRRAMDLQTHAMRSITANATLGSYQFQRNHVLPYMRKSLALAYQKTDLLRQTVSAIDKLERSTLAKLEAIKINTAAAAPQRMSMFKRLRLAVRDKNYDRVAMNISNAQMTGYDMLYRNFVSPKMTRFHNRLIMGGPGGGLNGISRAFARRLNVARNNLREQIDAQADTPGALATAKNLGRKTGAAILGGAVRFSQKLKLSPMVNTAASKMSTPVSSLVERLRPFADPLQQSLMNSGMGGSVPGGLAGSKALYDIEQSIQDWRIEQRGYHDKVLHHLGIISKEHASDPVTKASSRKPRSGRVTPTTPKPSSPTPSAYPGMEDDWLGLDGFNDPQDRYNFRDEYQAPNHPLPALWTGNNSNLPVLWRASGDALRGRTINKNRMRKRKVAFARLLRRLNFKSWMRTIGSTPTAPITNANPQALPSRRRLGPTRFSKREDRQQKFAGNRSFSAPIASAVTPKETIGEKLTNGRNYIQTLLYNLGTKMDSINESILQGNQEQLGAEHERAKHQTLVEKLLAGTKVRMNSYEDMMNKRRQAKADAGTDPKTAKKGRSKLGALFGLLGLGGAAADAEDPQSAKAKAGEEDDDDFTMTAAATAAGGAVASGAGWALGKGWKGAKKAGGLAGKGAKKGIPMLLKGGWNLSKFLTRQGGREARAIAKIFGKGGLKIAGSGLGKGLGIGLLAGIGKHYFDKSGVSGTDKRIGDTAFDMAGYGAAGASVGAMFGGIGAIPGALLGAGIGAMMANSDYVKKVASGLWTGIFGQKAIVRPDGTVIRQEKSSILGDLKIAIFGREARYSSTGEVIASKRDNLMGNITYGFQKFFWGDMYSNGEYKEGTSVVDMVRNGMSDAIKGFGDGLKAIPGNIETTWKSILEGVANLREDTANKDRAINNKVSGIIQNIRTTTSEDVLRTMKARALGGNDKAANFERNATAIFSQLTPDKAILGAADALKWLSPSGFINSMGNALFGWGSANRVIDDPTSPFYVYANLLLDAMGVRSRKLYSLVNSLILTQERINRNETKPYSDADMAYMATRFGFDDKNKDSVAYFSLWYKRRFIPAGELIDRILRAHKLNHSSVLSANEDQIASIIAMMRKELPGAGFRQLGLEPTVQSYNKYAKIGAQDPGGALKTSSLEPKPFEPRDSNANLMGNQNGSNDNSPYGQANGGQAYDTPDYSEGSGEPGRAARKRAKVTKGNIAQQPEFRAAYQKLPKNLQQMVGKSKTLQFVLWSTSVQHGADAASQIFQRDYADGLDEAAYVRSIYQDRSTRFGNVNSSDRQEAMVYLDREQQYAEGIASGKSKTDVGSMAWNIGEVVDPNAYGGASGDMGGDKQQRIITAYKFFRSRNYSHNAAIGIIANLLGESGLNPRVKPGDGGKAIGIAQWHPDRQARIARRFGRNIRQMGLTEQLAAVDFEMKETSEVKNNFVERLNRKSSSREAAYSVMVEYERPSEKNRARDSAIRFGHASAVERLVGAGGMAAGAPSTPMNQPQSAPAPRRPQPAPAVRSAPKPQPKPIKSPEEMSPSRRSTWERVAANPAPAGAPAGGTTNNTTNTNNQTIIAPIIGQQRYSREDFAAASVKRSRVAVGMGGG